MPMREGYADEGIMITSGEKMSHIAAANIKSAIDNFADRNYARLRGLILNRRNIDDEENLVRKFAREIDTEILGDVPRDANIHLYEEKNKTVIQGNPDLPVSQVIFDIARRISGNGSTS